MPTQSRGSERSLKSRRGSKQSEHARTSRRRSFYCSIRVVLRVFAFLVIAASARARAADVVILAPLPMEARWALTGCCAQSVIRDYRVIETGCGKVNATLAAAEQILNDKPFCVIQFGTAGRLAVPACPGALVAVTRAQQSDYGWHDRDVFARKPVRGPTEVYRPRKGWESSPYLLQVARMTARAIPDRAIRFRHGGSNSYCWTTCVFARAVSADQYITCCSRLSNIAMESAAAIIDMETAATAEACARLGVPFIALRAVTDTPEHNPTIDFRQTAEPMLNCLASWLSAILENLDTNALAREQTRLAGKYARRPAAGYAVFPTGERKVHGVGRKDFFAGRYKMATQRLLPHIERYPDSSYAMYRLLAHCCDYLGRPDLAAGVLMKAGQFARGVDREQLEAELNLHGAHSFSRESVTGIFERIREELN